MRTLKRLAWAVFRVLPLTVSRSMLIRYKTGRWPRLKNPVRLNDKINWRILHDHRPIWDWTCDKLAAKDNAARLSPGILLPEVLWCGADVRELSSLPIEGRWILKPNSSSHEVIVGSGTPDIEELARRVAKWDQNFTDLSLGEYAYRHARRVLVLERWITDSDEPPPDLKVFVFHGVARFIHVHRSRFGGHRCSMFTRDWTRVDAKQWHIPNDEITIDRPLHLDEVLRRAEEIGAEFDFIRVDLYDTDEGVWFGETTPYAWSGTAPFTPESFELELGSYWTLPDAASLKEVRNGVG